MLSRVHGLLPLPRSVKFRQDNSSSSQHVFSDNTPPQVASLLRQVNQPHTYPITSTEMPFEHQRLPLQSPSHLAQISSMSDAEALDIFAAFCPPGDAFLPFSSFYLLLLLLVARSRGQLLTVLHRCRHPPFTPSYFSNH